MNRVLFSFLVLWVFSLTWSELHSQSVELREKVIRMGADSVVIQIFQCGTQTPSYCFVHLHENEVASLEAGFRMLLKHGGILITLRHSRTGEVNRNISFGLEGTRFEFDPNRIFSEDENVLSSTLKCKSRDKAVRARGLSLVKVLAHAIWTEVQPFTTVVALHNNKNTTATCERKGWFGRRLVPESYNITSYVMKSDVSSESSSSAKAIYINPLINNSDFFIVTQPDDFDAIRLQNINVVLQNDQPVDDGSMSVYAFQQKKRYVNSEAKMGRVDGQFAMLEILHGILHP